MPLSRRDVLLPMLLTAGCQRSGNAPVRLVLVGLLEFFPVHLAFELGHYREEGVEVAIEILNSGTKIGESLIAESADVLYDAYAYTLLRADAERRLKAFRVVNLTSTNLLAVSPAKAARIQRTEELKGAVVGIGGFGGAQHRLLEYLVGRHGLALADVEVAAIGTGASAVAAMEHAKVDAAIMNWSSYTVLRRRAPATRLLIDLQSREERLRLFGTESFPTASLIATSKWLHGHPEQARRMCRALGKTIEWIRAHPIEEARAGLPERLRSADAEADLETMRAVASVLSQEGKMPQGGPELVEKIYTTAQERQQGGPFDLAQTWTDEFVKE